MKKVNEKIIELAKINKAKYIKTYGVGEENVKFKIVVPLLKVLGYSEDDMDFEHPVVSKKADIALIVNDKPTVIVETKALDKNLDDFIDQAINYAVHEGIPWVMLTNGIEIRLYSSFIIYHNPKDRLIFETNLYELPKSFDDLFEMLGKPNLPTAKKLTEEATAKQESITYEILVKDLAECKEKLYNNLLGQFKKRYKVDTLFTTKINAWAKEIKINMSAPDSIKNLCKEGAYTVINRVLFLRICEDKGHIPAKLPQDVKQTFADPAIFLDAAFLDIGKNFRGLYSPPLFDAISFRDIEWDTKTINFVLDRMSKHDFSKISKDILGRAYEQHISREERKQLGQFYTPDLVIDYILDHVRISPETKILDPACGSGGFLMKAYDRLRKQYLKQDWAEEEIHGKILSTNLYGIDINPFATQLTVMNLLLKDLDHPTNTINVVDGNSLHKLELTFDLDIDEKEHPLSLITDMKAPTVSLGKLLKKSPFDIVVSNPPYIFTRSMAITKGEKNYYKEHYKTATGKVNTFALFIEAGIERLSSGGRLGYIVPNTMLRVSTYEPLRRFILKNCIIEQIVDLGEGQFDKVTAETVIIILRKESSKTKRQNNVIQVLTEVIDLKNRNYTITKIPQHTFETNAAAAFNIFVDAKAEKLLSKIEKDCSHLGNISRKIIAGIATPKGKLEFISSKKLDSRYKKLIEGKNIDKYSIAFDNKYILYDRDLLHRARPEETFLCPSKIIVRRISGGTHPLIATLDNNQYYTFNSINNIILSSEGKSIGERYILALLNSKVLNYYFQNRFTNKANLTVNISKEYLGQLPIKAATPKTRQQLSKLVDKMLKLKQQSKAENTKATQAHIEKIELQIEEKVYEIYGIKKQEKSVIESSVTT